MKLICFPHAGGFSFYFNFFRKLGLLKREDLYLYEYPGRGTNSSAPKAQSLMQIATNAAEEIAAFVEQEDYCIFGHSMGAFVAYETEGILEREYARCANKLIVSGQHPPVCFEPDHYRFPTQDALNGYLLNLGGFPEEIQTNREIFDMLFGLCRDDITLLQQYCPTCNVVRAETIVLCGDRDVEVGDTMHLDLWRESTEKLTEIKIFPGTHFYMKEQEADFLQYISEVIKGDMIE